MKVLYISLIILTISANCLCAEKQSEEESYMKRMEWFENAKLGIFIHWGIYAVDGIDESWSFYNNYISYNRYMNQSIRFTAANYNPEDWAKLIKSTGAGYAVLTTKHHDGVALWDTKLSDLNTKDRTLAGKDLVTPFCNAMRKQGIKIGLYYSLIDWSDENYPNFTITEKRYKYDPVRWNKFVDFYQGQIEELSKNFKPDLFWFDGDWEQSAEAWKAKDLKVKLLKWNPDVIVNSRLAGYGDYDTPEQGVPVVKPDNRYWELCMTMNDSWGFQHHDTNYKTPYQILRIFVDCISMGGNLLLDIGPKEDGTIPDEQLEILKELARWNTKHHEAVFESTEGINTNHTCYPSTLSKDRKKLYLFVHDSSDGLLRVKGLDNNVKDVYVVGNSSGVKWEKEGETANKTLYMKLPEDCYDSQITVVCIELNEEIKLIEDLSVNEDYYLTSFTNNDVDINDVYVNQLVDKLTSGTSEEYGDYSEKGFGEWKEKHFEVLMNPEKGIPEGHFNGRTSLSENRDILYLYLNGKPNGPVVLKGIKNSINRIRVVGTGVKLQHKVFNKLYWSEVPGIVYIDVPEDTLDEYVTVIAVQLKGEIDLHR